MGQTRFLARHLLSHVSCERQQWPTADLTFCGLGRGWSGKLLEGEETAARCVLYPVPYVSFTVHRAALTQVD